MKKLVFLIILLISYSYFQAQEVGIIMGTARHYMQMGVEESLIKLKEMGIRHIEGAGTRSMNRVDYKKLLDKHGFDVVASGVSFDRIEHADSIKSIIENMKFYGAEYAVCYWIPHNGDDFTFADMQKGIEVFNRAGKQFAEAGIGLLYHAHGYEFRPYPGPGTMFDYMMEKLDPRYVNLEMDVFWMRNPGQNPAALMRKYKGRVVMTHLKDRMLGSVDNQNGRQDKERNVVLGDGDVNIAEVMKAARETGVKYHMIEDESSRAMVQLPMHLQYLKSLNYDVTAVEMSMKQLQWAMIGADSVALRNLTCEELTYGHSNGRVEGKESFVTDLARGVLDVKTLEFKDQEITVKGNVAWVRNNMIADLVSSGNPSKVDLKVLFVWTKVDGMWKLLARQAVKVVN